MMGGARHQSTFDRLGNDPEAWLDLAKKGVQRQLGVDGESAQVAKVLLSEQAIPQYQVGHNDRKIQIQDST